MEVDFLEAVDGRALTKAFERATDGSLIENPYPKVRDFRSVREEVSTPDEFYESIVRHAGQGRCMMKGLLDRPLEGESRAGHHDRTASTRWLLLDLDFDEGWSSVDDFLRDLNPDWLDTTYVWQHSASAGIKYDVGLRGHLWLLLDQPVIPDEMKVWLQERNFSVPRLNQKMELTADGLGVKYPLDISTCQNDKLIFIAPPQLTGIEDPLDSRIQLVKRRRDFAPAPDIRTTTGAVNHMRKRRVEELRTAAGMPRKEPKFKDLGSFELLDNPDEAMVTEYKVTGDYVRLNLNGGDSWAYWFPVDDPSILFNFKNEPPVALRKIAPAFYHEYKRALLRAKYGNIQPYVFLEAVRDRYYKGLYDVEQEHWTLGPLQSDSERKLKHHMEEFGGFLPDPIPTYTLVFDPTTTQTLDTDQQWANLYHPSQYILDYERGNLPRSSRVPAAIQRIIDSICGHEPEVIEHFLNWLAVVFQTRAQTGTAWVFHGVPGTGKGLFLNEVLKPLLGRSHVQQWRFENFEEQYNGNLAHTNLLWLDEFKADSGKSLDAVMNDLKYYITEPELTIREMRTNKYQAPSYLNIIVATNHPDPVRVDPRDRRFNVAPAQENPMQITEHELEQIRSSEVDWFAQYLAHRAADAGKARQVIQTNAREDMIIASQTTHDAFFRAVREGDLDWFLKFLRADMPVADLTLYARFEQHLKRWITESKGSNGPIAVLSTELMDCLQYTTSGRPQTAQKFSKSASIHRLGLEQVPAGSRRVQGVFVEWKYTDEANVEALLRETNQTLSVIEGGKQ